MHQAFDIGKNYRVADKSWLNDQVFSLWIEAPEIARVFRAGQFVIVRRDDHAERIPLTIIASDESGQHIRLVVKVSGYSTRMLSLVKPSDYLLDVAGPLGQPVQLRRQEKPVLMVAAGVGAAVLLPVGKSLREEGCRVRALIGAGSRELLILAGEWRESADSVEFATEDGSEGFKGLVTELLIERLGTSEQPDMIFAAGPVGMMKVAAEVALQRKVPVSASLRPLILDGMGMCGGCRVSLGDEIRYACIDGPFFDGARVHWDELMLRLEESGLREKWIGYHTCRLDQSGALP